jgi:hypothetical protein
MRIKPMNKTMMKSAFLMSFALLGGGVSAPAAASDTWNERIFLGGTVFHCRVKVLPVTRLGKGTHQIGCYREGGGAGPVITFISDQMFTWKWSLAGGNKKSTRYDCSQIYAYPQLLSTGGLITNPPTCLKDPVIMDAFFDTKYYGKHITRINTYEPCRGDAWNAYYVYYDFWAEGTVKFNVKHPTTGMNVTLTTPFLKGPKTGYLSGTSGCNW